MPTNNDLAKKSLVHWRQNKRLLSKAVTTTQKEDAISSMRLTSDDCAFCTTCEQLAVTAKIPWRTVCITRCALSKIGENCHTVGSAYNKVLRLWRSLRIRGCTAERYENLRKAVEHMIDVIRKAGLVPD